MENAVGLIQFNDYMDKNVHIGERMKCKYVSNWRLKKA